jgi:MATE family, multidrug efflux pump
MRHMDMRRSEMMIKGPVGRGILALMLPTLATSALQSLNGVVNAMWIGRYLGEASLAAISNANTIMVLLLGGAFGAAMAAAILVGQCIGAQDISRARQVVGTGAVFFVCGSLIVAVAGVIFAQPVLESMGTPAESLPLAIAYLRWLLVALPLMYVYTFVTLVLRSSGNANTPFYFMLLSVGIGIILNPLFIFGAGPVPKLGAVGSALATFVSQGAGLAGLVGYLYAQRHPLCVGKHELSPADIDRQVVDVLVRRGLPMSAHVLVVALSGVLMISLVNRFGVQTTAAFGASLQLWNYIQMPAFAVSMAVSAMAAQNVGAQRWDRVRSIGRIGVICGVCSTGLVALLVEVLDKHVLACFVPPGSATADVASHINRVAIWSFVLQGVSTALFGVVRATGAVLVPLVILITVLGIRFPLTEALLDRWQAEAIWWSFPCAAALTAVLAITYYKYGGWRAVQLQSLGRAGDLRGH